MKIPHNKITFDDKEVSVVQNVVASGYWAGGPIVQKTEKAISEFFNVKDSVCVGSGLAALRLALLSLKITEGDEVIIPAYSCVALANAALSIGATPIAVDNKRNDFNLDPCQVQQSLSSKTKAIIVVNTFGQPCDKAALKEFNLPIIEDCSHGFGIEDVSNPTKFISDIVIFSFYATKLIAGGEGGAILSSDKSVIQFCKEYRDYTNQLPDGNRLNDKMTDIEAALVQSQIQKLPNFLELRFQAAKRYQKLLSDAQNIILPNLDHNRVWYRYAVSLDKKYVLSDFIEELEKYGVSAREPVDNWLPNDIEEYSNAQYDYQTTLSLPLYPSITEEEQVYVCKKLKEILKNE